MDEPILVTGGTGTVRREVMRRLRDAGQQPRALSGRQGPPREVAGIRRGGAE
jgi:uncharacterized protein YbjT (DUF2867 family)